MKSIRVLLAVVIVAVVAVVAGCGSADSAVSSVTDRTTSLKSTTPPTPEAALLASDQTERFYAQAVSARVGETITIPVMINTQTTFAAFSISASYDPRFVEVVSIGQITGENSFDGLIAGNPNASILLSGSRDLEMGAIVQKNQDNGLYTAFIAGISAPKVFSGNVALCAITFKVLMAGKTAINIAPRDTSLVNSNLETLPSPSGSSATISIAE